MPFNVLVHERMVGSSVVPIQSVVELISSVSNMSDTSKLMLALLRTKAEQENSALFVPFSTRNGFGLLINSVITIKREILYKKFVKITNETYHYYLLKDLMCRKLWSFDLVE